MAMKIRTILAVGLLSSLTFSFSSPARSIPEELRSFCGRFPENSRCEGLNIGVIKLLESNECQGCDLKGANLEGANLEGANLRNAYLVNANLDKANLEQASLNRAKLKNSTLRNANLKQSKLRSVNLNGADLEGAILYDAYLAQCARSLTCLFFK